MSSFEQAVLIVGAGAAGHGCARALRTEGFSGPIRLINGEGAAPINRTLVDKGVLPGLLTAEQIALPPLPDVEVIDARAARLDGTERAIVLDDGRVLRGIAVVLAPGSAPRALDAAIAVDGAVRLHAMHAARDAQALREALPEPAGARLVILGAGFIGAEVASHFAEAGARVTLVGRSPLPLRAALGTEIATRLAALRAERVDARLGAEVVAIRAASAAATPAAPSDAAIVELADGSELTADAVLVVVGSRPDAAWAGFDGAIAVDDRMRVEGADGVYAAGSAAAVTGGLRADHWDAAGAQGAHAARAVLHDLGLAEDPGPWRVTTGFTLMAHGAVVAGRGSAALGAAERPVELEGGGLITELTDAHGVLTGVVGWNAGPHVARAASRLGVA
ncbi:hypothetical protein D8Y24_03785 [Agrococcus lahaulensis]|nr:hypothetical protein D8Y24_03785 [Agrococcus lahaulensis]